MASVPSCRNADSITLRQSGEVVCFRILRLTVEQFHCDILGLCGGAGTQGEAVMFSRMLAAGAIGLMFAASGAGAFEYKGICEASAGAFVDDKHFVVASDETNLLQLYERGKADPIGDGIDM